MATKYIENIGGVAGDAASALTNVLKVDAAGNVVPFVCDAVDGMVKYYDRVNSKVAQVARLNQPVISAITTLTVTEALHAGRTIVLNLVAGFAIQLPAATGSGAKYRFVNGIASNAYVISAVVATDVFAGGYGQNDTGGSAAVTWDFMPTAATDNTYSPTTLGGGGLIGDWIEFEDIIATTWAVRGTAQGVIDPTNRFSHV